MVVPGHEESSLKTIVMEGLLKTVTFELRLRWYNEGIAIVGPSKERQGQGPWGGSDSDASDSQMQKNTKRSIKLKLREEEEAWCERRL